MLHINDSLKEEAPYRWLQYFQLAAVFLILGYGVVLALHTPHGHDAWKGSEGRGHVLPRLPVHEVVPTGENRDFSFENRHFNTQSNLNEWTFIVFGVDSGGFDMSYTKDGMNEHIKSTALLTGELNKRSEGEARVWYVRVNQYKQGISFMFRDACGDVIDGRAQIAECFDRYLTIGGHFETRQDAQGWIVENLLQPYGAEPGNTLMVLPYIFLVDPQGEIRHSWGVLTKAFRPGAMIDTLMKYKTMTRERMASK